MSTGDDCLGMHLYTNERWMWSADQLEAVARWLPSRIGVNFTHISGLRGLLVSKKSNADLQAVLDRRGLLSLVSFCGSRVYYFDQQVWLDFGTDPGSLSIYVWQRLLPDGNQALEEAIEVAVMAGFRPYAGYLYRWPMRYGPDAYAFGSLTNPDSRYTKEERARVSRWNLAFNGFRSTRGYLRDVYSGNILSGSLSDDLRVSGQPLLAWIDSGEGRGTIVEIGTSFFLWRLSDDELPRVRADLIRENLLIAEHQYGAFSQREPAKA